jgi:glutaryl-CoA dehydrogenase (non-decarboxylating)
MNIGLTHQQEHLRASFRKFVNEKIIPYAKQYDEEEFVPGELLKSIAQEGYWGASISRERGGQDFDMITCGLLNEEVGRGCSSVRNMLTAHCMVASSIQKWGTTQQKERWLPKMASGKTIAAFGLTEPRVGSDAKSVETSAEQSGDHYILTGIKKWITSAQIADLYLIIARGQKGLSAFLVERDCPGLFVKPIKGMLGLRASMLGELCLNGCRVPSENLLGKPGVGFSHITSYALDYGRYSVAWGCVGIAQACLEACVKYTSEREQFGDYLKNHQLIQEMIANMITNTKAARLLCCQAAYLRSVGDMRAIMETSIAKYFASTIATRVASDAVQIHGANGCSSEYAVGRYLRDAKIMEIIEGSNQIQQITIANYSYHEYGS